MEQFGLIKAIQAECANRGWRFVSGDRWERNAQITKEGIDVGEIIMTAFVNSSTPRFVTSQIDRITYTAEIMLGRKFDAPGDVSSLDETFIQKYERRLEELSRLIASFLASFSCDHGLTIQNASFQYYLNQFDENVDFCGGNVTFIDEEFKPVV